MSTSPGGKQTLGRGVLSLTPQMPPMCLIPEETGLVVPIREDPATEPVSLLTAFTPPPLGLTGREAILPLRRLHSSVPF